MTAHTIRESALSLDELEALASKRRARDLIGIARRAERTGGCARPIRVKARGPDSSSGDEPDGVLLVACKTRRETRCPSCADTYRGDARQLVRAGIEGGKGVPESVSSHPAVFLTLTAPSFGAVHRAGTGQCHLGPPGRCEHGHALHCLRDHPEEEAIVGSALCRDCYDHEAAVVFNASAGELWRRVSIYARRHLAYLLHMPERELKDLVRLSYLKVAELQRRGVVHLHAIVRVDSVADELSPPEIGVTSDLLAEALVRAVRAVHFEYEVGDRTHVLSFGQQLKVQRLEPGTVGAIASYLGKYLTKSASGDGVLDHRLREGELEYLDLPDHLRAIVETAWRLGGHRGLERLRRWAHALGYTGHLMTKSHRYSTTFLRLRAARLEWRLQQSGDEEAAEALSAIEWTFEGQGHRHEIDVILAATVAAHRRTARWELWDERIAANQFARPAS